MRPGLYGNGSGTVSAAGSGAGRSIRSMYHEDSRALQDRFDTRGLADRLDERFVAGSVIDPPDKDFIERVDMFFIATADAHGRPQCSYKGGEPGFVRVLDEHTLAFPPATTAMACTSLPATS